MTDEAIGYIGVKSGEPIFRKVSDERGDCIELAVFKTPEEALARYHNVRRARLVIDPEPQRAPAEWGHIDD